MRRFAQRFAVSSLLVLATAVVPAGASAAGCSRRRPRSAELGQEATAHATLCLLNRSATPPACASCAPTPSCAAPPTATPATWSPSTTSTTTSKSGASFVDPHQAHRLDQVAPLLDRRREHRLRLAAPTRPRARWSSGWMHSSGHRANILARQFRCIGIGVANGAPDRRHRRDLRHRFRRLSSAKRAAP